MSQVTKSASAFVRAFLAILMLELEDMVVRLVRPPKLASVHGYRWTVRLCISVGARCPVCYRCPLLSGYCRKTRFERISNFSKPCWRVLAADRHSRTQPLWIRSSLVATTVL